jgi:hypothetical protein
MKMPRQDRVEKVLTSLRELCGARSESVIPRRLAEEFGLPQEGPSNHELVERIRGMQVSVRNRFCERMVAFMPGVTVPV